METPYRGLELKSDTTNIYGLHLEMRMAMKYLDIWFSGHRKAFVITSARDSIHIPRSLHYYGYAVDVRTRHLTDEQKEDLVKFMQEKCPVKYNVLLESDHLHVGYNKILNKKW